MDEVIEEIILFGNCSSLFEFNFTLEKIQKLIESSSPNNEEKEIINYLEKIKNNYTQYIKRILEKPRKQRTIENNILSIFDETVYLLSFGIIVNDVIIYDNKRLSAYYLLKSIQKHFNEDNIKVFTNDFEDYVACYIFLLNIFFSIGGGRNIHSVLLDDIKDNEFENCVYISENIFSKDLPLKKINAKNILTILSTKNISDEKDKQHYKQKILEHFTPKQFYRNIMTDKFYPVLLSPGSCRMFTLNTNEENLKNVVYTSLSDWTREKQTVVLHGNMELLNRLYLYEEDTRHIENIVDIKNNFDNSYFNEDIEMKFNRLDIRNDILRKIVYREVLLKDVLTIIRQPGSNIDKQGTKYPYVATVNYNNGITCFVDRFDTIASRDSPVISIGLTRSGKGFAYVHTYNFTHSPDVALFHIKNSDINPYNLAFSITEKMCSIKLPNHINTKFILNLVVDVLSSDIV